MRQTTSNAHRNNPRHTSSSNKCNFQSRQSPSLNTNSNSFPPTSNTSLRTRPHNTTRQPMRSTTSPLKSSNSRSRGAQTAMTSSMSRSRLNRGRFTRICPCPVSSRSPRTRCLQRPGVHFAKHPSRRRMSAATATTHSRNHQTNNQQLIPEVGFNIRVSPFASNSILYGHGFSGARSAFFIKHFSISFFLLSHNLSFVLFVFLFAFWDKALQEIILAFVCKNGRYYIVYK